MRVEGYSDRYFLDVVELVKNFHEEAVAEYDALFDVGSLIEVIKANRESDTAFLLIENDSCQGILFGMKYKAILNDKEIFQEVIWFVNKPFRRYGVMLLTEAEKLLKSKGIEIMIMAVLENSKTEKLKKFYGRLGYKPMEQHWVRNL